MAYKIALVGTGMIANAGHIPAWKNLGNRAHIVGVANRNLKKAQDTAGRHGIENSFDNLDDLLIKTSPDIVSVCTPNVSHAGGFKD